MPNYCDYTMKVTGKSKESLEEFVSIIKANYDYDKGEIPVRHFCRVFDAYSGEIIDKEDGIYEVDIDGYCAWNAYSCFSKGAHTYHDYINKTFRSRSRATCIQNECRRLNLFVEIFTEETGMAFQEHIICSPKGILKTEYKNIHFNENEDDTYEVIDGFNCEFKSFTLADFELYKYVKKNKCRHRKKHKKFK